MSFIFVQYNIAWFLKQDSKQRNPRYSPVCMNDATRGRLHSSPPASADHVYHYIIMMMGFFLFCFFPSSLCRDIQDCFCTPEVSQERESASRNVTARGRKIRRPAPSTRCRGRVQRSGHCSSQHTLMSPAMTDYQMKIQYEPLWCSVRELEAFVCQEKQLDHIAKHFRLLNVPMFYSLQCLPLFLAKNNLISLYIR